MLSPGENYRNLIPGESVEKYWSDILIFTAKEDTYSASSSQKLASFNESSCTLQIFDGADHGTDIINNNPEAMKALVDWLLSDW